MELGRNFIGGSWVEPKAAFHIDNPSDLDDRIGEYAESDEQEVLEAVHCARTAFTAWSQTNSARRSDALQQIATELKARKEELGNQLAREQGKVLPDAISEVQKSAQVFQYFAAEALRTDGHHFPALRDGIDVQALQEPVGIVAILTPWNLPLGTPSWKIAPALAFGNCVVFKPSEVVSASAWSLTDIISRSGIPPGVFNLVMGRGPYAGSALVNSSVDAITFTGSDVTGNKIAQAAARNQTKLQMEMGGKNPLLVLDDADIENAATCALQGAFYAAGQRCTASSRLIVTRKVHDQFVGSLISKMKSLRVGHALAPESQIGPIVSEQQLSKNLAYLEIARSEGAELAVGGERLNRSTSGYYMSPALYVNTSNSMRLNQEEIFGPIAAVTEVEDYEEGLQVANDTRYGLAAGICTSNMKLAAHFRKHIQAGICMINLPTAGSDFHAPFGGKKASSYGSHELSLSAREFYTSIKTIYSVAA